MKQDFKYFLDSIGEVGYVEQLINSVAYVSGLPKVTVNEVLFFEEGARGYVLGIDEEMVEVLIFSRLKITVGSRVARTGQYLMVKLGTDLLGKRLDGLGNIVSDGINAKLPDERSVDAAPLPIMARTALTKPLETGVSVVDLVVPIAMAQRELIIGDRNTGKTSFLMQVILNQAKKGTICIYCAIGKKRVAIKRFEESFKAKGVWGTSIIIGASASESAALVYITPYTAMTIAEYFRDLGRDVLLILDDMTTHAKYYREISLLTKRFPGRNSYPGDIFYIHSRLIERAGSFEKASITCLPVAESTLGDLSGYVQTNLMSMTDGHIYLDGDMMSEGRFPPVNPFLSVTRVGLQAQRPLFKDISRSLTTFLVSFEKLKAYMHFGAELTEAVRKTLSFGEKIEDFFSQPSTVLMSANLSGFVLACIWSDIWRDITNSDLEKKIEYLRETYEKDNAFKLKVDELITTNTKFSDLVEKIKQNQEQIFLVNSSQPVSTKPNVIHTQPAQNS